MSTYLEAYARFRIPHQLPELRDLTVSIPPHIAEVFPGLRNAYRGPLSAIRRIGRIAQSNEVQAYIIREKKDRPAIGIATIISGTDVRGPNDFIPVHHGYDLDYWIKDNSSELHGKVGDAVIEAAKRIALTDAIAKGTAEATDDGYRTTYLDAFATALVGVDPQHNIGITEQLWRVGEPVELQSIPADDPHGVTRNHRLVQFYERKFLVTA